MIQKKLYRYVGRNGIITSLVEIDKATFFPMYRLIAEKGKILTNGKIQSGLVDVFPEDVEQWQEIDDPSSSSEEEGQI